MNTALCALADDDIVVAPMITGEARLDGVVAAVENLAVPERHCTVAVTPFSFSGLI